MQNVIEPSWHQTGLSDTENLASKVIRYFLTKAIPLLELDKLVKPKGH